MIKDMIGRREAFVFWDNFPSFQDRFKASIFKIQFVLHGFDEIMKAFIRNCRTYHIKANGMKLRGSEKETKR